ncbi:MAG: hypothetical protein ACTSRA_06465 [Promethearchaeota archaeon]
MKIPQTRKNTTLLSATPFLCGLIFVTSGWDWGLLPESIRLALWILTQRGLSLWLLTSIIYLSLKMDKKENWREILVSFLFVGCGLYINTRQGYGFFLYMIQAGDTVSQRLQGWIHAVLVGISCGLGMLSVFLFIQHNPGKKKRLKLMLAFFVVLSGALINQGILYYFDDLDTIAALVWTSSLIIGAIPILYLLGPGKKRCMLGVLIQFLCFFLLACIITSYYTPPPIFGIDRHKIAELTWGLGFGIGIQYIFRKYLKEMMNQP